MGRSLNHAQILWTYFWVSPVARERPKRLNAMREVARRMVRLIDEAMNDLGKEEMRRTSGVLCYNESEARKRVNEESANSDGDLDWQAHAVVGNNQSHSHSDGWA